MLHEVKKPGENVTSTGSNESNSFVFEDRIEFEVAAELKFAELLAFVSDFCTFIEGIY
jgi:hypothetical protein